ncbi:hypothetical protein MRBLWO14_003145 [Microbacterium sp. LWO14-1.2]|uniref:hypothetical protein n=1 Tax=Microbacterium sp. LWO14-1.2 TaxID=3135263 RepID=UPI00313A1F79
MASSPFERALAETSTAGDASDAEELGRMRVTLLRELARLPDTATPVPDNIAEAIASFAVEAWKTAGRLRQTTPRRTIVWNEELAVTEFIGRTMLLADHVLFPDRVLRALSGSPMTADIRRAANNELQFQHLIRAGHALPMPDGAAQALGGARIYEGTEAALANPSLLSYVRSQLVLEGPTAREVLFVNAIDDIEHNTGMWFHGHTDLTHADLEDREVGFRMLGNYDPGYDYSAWIDQVTNSALAKYVQRTERRLTVSEVLGADYVATSPFEARVLQRRGGHTPGAPGATMWADVPTLRDVTAKDLARMLSEDDAIEDLRGRVRIAMATTPDFVGQVAGVQAVASDIENASRTLAKRIGTSRSYAMVIPAAVGGLGMVVGAAGGVAGFAAGALGVIASLSPYLGERLNHRREAAYLLTMPRRRRN